MKTFREFIKDENITEGVIKAPQKMKSQIETYIWQSFLKRNYDWVSKLNTYLSREGGYQELVDLGVSISESDLIEEIEKYKSLMREYKVKDQKAGKKQEKFTKSFKVDLSDLPKNYPPIAEGIPKEIKVKLVFNKAERVSGGHWVSLDPKTGKGELKIDLSDQTSLREYNPLFNSSNIDVAKRAMSAKFSTLEHELMHMVQSYVLAPTDTKQVETNYQLTRHSKKMTDYDAYFNSQIEFDPTIVSSVAQFKMIKDHLTKKGVKFKDKEQLEFFVSAKPYRGQDEGFYVSPFFAALKKHDKPKWKKAIKKLVSLLKERGISK